MNILFLTDLYPIDESDIQTSTALKDFTDNFRNLGHNVQVIRPNFLLNSFLRGKKYYKTGQYNEVFNANYITPFWFNVKNKLPKINDYDIVISHMPSGSIFAENFRGKLICGIHISDIKVLIQPIYSLYFKKKLLDSFKRAEKLVCRSFHIQKKLLKLYPEFKEKTVVIPSGVDENLIIKRDIELKETVKVLTAANLIKRKNIDKLIKACDKIENIELTVIGDGKELENLKKISKKPIFSGKLTKQEVIDEMKKSDIFILPSVNETFGLVYIEAMASGCITVGTVNDGIDGIIKDGVNGFLAKPNKKSIEETLNKIINLKKEEITKISENCFYTIKNYTTEACSVKYLQTIIKVL